MLPQVSHRTTNPGHAVATITATRTLTSSSAEFQSLTASGGNVNVDLPALVNSYGLKFLIKNAGASNNIVVRNAAAATIATLTPGLSAILFCDGATWVASSLAGSGLLADGSIAGATGAAQDFGANGVKADVWAGSTGTTGNHGVSLTDNLASAFYIKEGANSYLTTVTTNGAEQFTFAKYLQTAGNVRQTADVTAAENVTVATLTGLTVNLLAGKTYTYSGKLFTDSTANGGVKVAIGGTATATAILTEAQVFAGTTLNTSTQTTSITNIVAATVASTSIVVSGTITVNAAGTFILQGAQNASHVDTTTFKAGSFLNVQLVA